MKRRTLLLLAALCLAGAHEARAQAAGAFARMGFGARGIAMSNALVADLSGDASPYYNPALAPFAPEQSLELSAARLTLDRELQFVQFATPLRPRAGVAAGFIHAGVSNIDGRDGSGYHTQNYSTDEFGFFLAFGTRIGDRATIGAGLQFFRADLFDQLKPVTSIGLDLGLGLRVTEALSLGLSVDDLLARYAWDSSTLYTQEGKRTTDRFPTRVRLGAAYRLLEGRALVTAEYEGRITSSESRTRSVTLVGNTPREVFETEQLHVFESRFRAGAEMRLAEPFAVRAGLDRFGAEGLGGVQPSAGFMVEQQLGQLTGRAEYAFALEPYAVGAMHVLTLRVFL